MAAGISQYIYNFGNGLDFTQDNTTTDQPILLTGNPAVAPDTTNLYFTLGDNVLIESIGLYIPYQYSQGDNNATQIGFQWYDKAAHTGVLFGTVLPALNQELPIDVYLNPPATATTQWGIRIGSVAGLWANQINSPAILQGQAIHSRLSLRVRHTLPMIA